MRAFFPLLLLLSACASQQHTAPPPPAPVAASDTTTVSPFTPDFSSDFGSGSAVKDISGPTVVIMPSHTLIVYLSEDAYNGDAQVQLTIGGANVFAKPVNVTAKHALNQRQVFTILGAWPSKPQVTITFNNDAWGGDTSKDRNLYVVGSVYDNVASKVTRTLCCNGSWTFTP
jgi:hypothetical protein